MFKHVQRLIVAVVLSVFFSTLSFASKIDVSGFIGVESKVFLDEPQFTGQENEPEVSLIMKPEFRFKTEDRKHQFTFVPFARIDSRDDHRTHFDVREAYWLYVGDQFEFLAGINKVFWGVAESRHLVDIINQTDAVEDFDGEDKFGSADV